MNEILEILGDTIPLMLFLCLFAVICIAGSIGATKEYRRYKREGKTADAEILGYRKKKIKGVGFPETLHMLTVSCVSPCDGERHVYVFTSDRHNVKKFRKLKHTRLYFLPDSTQPQLEVNTFHIIFDSVFGMIGGVLFALAALVILLIVIDHFVGIGIIEKIRETFFQ